MKNAIDAPSRKLTFQEWCHFEGGVDRVADILGIPVRTVKSWYYVEGNPAVPMMQRLISLSKNRLSYESIIDSTQPISKRGAH